ncbi:LexA family transcriptional regulator [Mucilaginibacter glaciei]|uniref:Helix-turn-helix domain-containing protein n=1 Tax=Mucilaginibacter glaciei TaxID=2772109 RepID=A0A926NTG4_9SPHI|nr:helix-turn-helix domain-containing protein [Mucilaginibacter glaciei]MBD1394297.1 helix-turn-helix domain-containing protein [Mucilaginibacter glaciei]
MKNTQKEFILDKSLVLNKIKSYYQLKNDIDLANFLDIRPNTLSNWRARNSFDYEILYTKCVGIDANFLITGKGRMFRLNKTADALNEPEMEYTIDNNPEISKNDKTIFLTPQIVTVDGSGSENITYVPVKAAAGYLNGYKDREYIESLTSFNLPGLTNATYRAFEVSGDSMFPTLEDKEMVIGQWVEKLEYIREDRVHIVVTKNDGVVVKRLLNRIDKYGYIVAKSDAVNDRGLYKNKEIYPDDILEIWYAVWHGGFNFKSPSDLWKRQNNLEADLTDVLKRLNQLEEKL